MKRSRQILQEGRYVGAGSRKSTDVAPCAKELATPSQYDASNVVVLIAALGGLQKGERHSRVNRVAVLWTRQGQRRNFFGAGEFDRTAHDDLPSARTASAASSGKVLPRSIACADEAVPRSARPAMPCMIAASRKKLKAT